MTLGFETFLSHFFANAAACSPRSVRASGRVRWRLLARLDLCSGKKHVFAVGRRFAHAVFLFSSFASRAFPLSRVGLRRSVLWASGVGVGSVVGGGCVRERPTHAQRAVLLSCKTSRPRFFLVFFLSRLRCCFTLFFFSLLFFALIISWIIFTFVLFTYLTYST